MTEKILLVFFFSLIILLSFIQVILREFFSYGWLWADTFLRHLVLWVGFLGAALAAGKEKHFVIDIAKKLFPEKWRLCIEIITNSCAMVCLYFLSQAAIRFIKDDMTSGSILFRIHDMAVPSYWMNAIIPAGFILLLIHFGLNTLEKIFLLIPFLSKKTEK
jgi:C4-dicarboxylate transporter, DctQ subunit